MRRGGLPGNEGIEAGIWRPLFNLFDPLFKPIELSLLLIVTAKVYAYSVAALCK